MSLQSLRRQLLLPELYTLTMKSIMTPAPITVDEDTDLKTARHLLRENGIRHLPVVHSGKLKGILSDRDAKLVSLLPDIGKMAVADIMTRHPSTVTEDTPVLEAVTKMAEHKYGCLVITGKEGDVRGIFTTHDAIRLLLGEKGLNCSDSKPTAEEEDDDERQWD